MESLHSQVYHFGKFFQSCKASRKGLFREDRVNELHRKVIPKRSFDVPEVLEVHVLALCPDDDQITNSLPTSNAAHIAVDGLGEATQTAADEDHVPSVSRVARVARGRPIVREGLCGLPQFRDNHRCCEA